MPNPMRSRKTVKKMIAAAGFITSSSSGGSSGEGGAPRARYTAQRLQVLQVRVIRPDDRSPRFGFRSMVAELQVGQTKTLWSRSRPRSAPVPRLLGTL